MFNKIKTPKELLDAIHRSLNEGIDFEGQPKVYPGANNVMGDVCSIAQQAAIRIRAGNPSLNLPPVPSSRNTVDIQNWCIDSLVVWNSIANPKQTETQKSRDKQPTKEMCLAYKLTRLMGMNQTEAAEIMSKELKKSIKQYQVSKLAKKHADYLKKNDLPVENSAPKTTTIYNTDVLDMGARTDGRTGKAPEK